ncbi:NUDIX hydrolase [Candidatus Saccharibacteria bacterium]|jgi:ADP-ribose pyrophosphatase|nr:NUDIX hydrolase [Candidatus Saccharibacteria bacterium]
MTKPLPKNAKLVPKEAKKVFSGEIFDTYQWLQKMYDDSTVTFEMLKRADTVLMLGVLNDEKVLLLEQEQPDRPKHWTIPAGRVDQDEDILTAAKREMREETGYDFADWRLVYVEQAHTKIEWFSYLFVATNPVEKGEQSLDAGEKISVYEVEYKALVELVRDGSINWAGAISRALLNGQDQLSDILTLSDITTNA